MTLQDALTSPRSGNLDHLRLLAAAAVIVSHAWPLAYGPGASEPLVALTGHSLGGWAVALFFFLSGLLIHQSASRRGMLSFWTARARRIWPGLVVALLVTVLLAKVTGSSATLAEALTYALRGLGLMSIEHRLSEAFVANPYPLAVNGPLWSLSHEVMAYALCHAVVLSGLLRGRFGLGILFGASLAFWGADPLLPARLATFAPLWLAFVLGMAAAHLAARLRLSVSLALALTILAPLGWPLAVAALGFGGLVLALTLPRLPRWGDISFGMYIYGWPVAQTVLHLWPGLDAPSLAIVSLTATLPLAALSWWLIEEPSMQRAKPVKAVA